MALSQSTSLPTLQSPFHKLQFVGVSRNRRELTILTTAKTPTRCPLVSLCRHTARRKPLTISCVAVAFHDDGAREASSSPSTSISSIFVKGLADSVSEGRLKKVFSEFGEVGHVKIIVNERTRQSLGYGYVWFSKRDDAQLAVEAMNGKFFDGRFILVKFGQPGLSRRRRSHSDFLFVNK
ncbi:RNA-binding (RRM/RBD/RNP motifs) family protein [Raphanus sativus]|uniref:Organelle RRM domain-containing protein 1, chloroplastic n=1 Tax=Raphanus sativus TaxID=3726 RepID=A0A6J0MWU5_RAPSA|nr:organelle RRM domain-containing protein 1, chloroplastic [Raphanus sativus]KAJ4908180.1 RNA-binding (RRM/RBD/RNP motifs) family protein [Raphanus sativus]